MLRVSVATKVHIGKLILQGRTSTSIQAKKLLCRQRTVRRYAGKVRNGCPIFEGKGRPKSLDEVDFVKLVAFARGLPLENRVYNEALHQKYRELTRDTVIRRLRYISNNFNDDEIVVPFSRRSRSRYCRLAVARSLEV